MRTLQKSPIGVLAGSARFAQEAQERATERERQRDVERKRVMLDRKRRQIKARVQSLRAKYEEAAELEREIAAAQDAERTRGLERVAMARKRKADVIGNGDQH